MTSLEDVRSRGLSACVLGYTGEVGKALVGELDRLKLFRRVVLVGRREVPLNTGPEFEQRKVDFDNLSDYRDVFSGVNVTFCCLGTTRAKSGKEGFIRVDKDYVLTSAEIAKSAGCDNFALVSSTGADKSSCFLYPRVKGEVEESLKNMEFGHLAIFRPGFLICNRAESRPAETFMQCILKSFLCCCPTAMAVPVRVVAMAMIYDLCDVSEKVKEYDNKSIHRNSTISNRSCCCC